MGTAELQMIILQLMQLKDSKLLSKALLLHFLAINNTMSKLQMITCSKLIDSIVRMYLNIIITDSLSEDRRSDMGRMNVRMIHVRKMT